MKLLIFCAQDSEALALRESGVDCRVVLTGVGFRAASKVASDTLGGERPELVLSIGTCGALREELRLGDVLSPRRILSSLGEFEPRPLNAREGTLVSQDRVAVSTRDKAALRFQGGDIVDMEAAAIAKVCEARNLPFGCLKAVSDIAVEDLPLDFNLYRDAEGKFLKTQIAFAGILKLPALMRLNSQNKLASKALRLALRQALS